MIDNLYKLLIKDKLKTYEKEHDLYLLFVKINPNCQDDKHELKLINLIKKYEDKLNV